MRAAADVASVDSNATESTVIAGALAVRGLLARPGRWALVGLSLVLGVGSVTSAFAARDGLVRSFDQLFVDANGDIDLFVRSRGAVPGVAGLPLPFGSERLGRGVAGIARAEAVLRVNAPIVTADGRALGDPIAPRVAMIFDGQTTLDGVALVAGHAPHGTAEGALDDATAARATIALGDTISVAARNGSHRLTVVGLLRKRIDDDPVLSTVVGIDPTAFAELTGASGIDGVALALMSGTTSAEAQASVAGRLPATAEVVTAAELAEESAGTVGPFVRRFGNLLLIFAGITVFVGGFLVANVFAITVNQRVRELAVLRALGATRRQVQHMVLVEAMLVGALATVLGLVAGMLGARGVIHLFNTGGYGLPRTSPVLTLRTIALAVVAGPIVAVVAALVPARRASILPPVAAMRPELVDNDETTHHRPRWPIAAAVGGATSFIVALTARPGSGALTVGCAAAGIGAMFVGVTNLAARLVRPVGMLLGWPIVRRFGVVGRLARDNAIRNPRRTTATATTLAIGICFVTVATVFAASLRQGMKLSLRDAVQAEFLAYGGNQGVPAAFVERARALPDISAVSGFHGETVMVNTDAIRLAGVDPATLPLMIDLGVTDGRIEDLHDGETFVAERALQRRGLHLGDSVTMTWRDGHTTTARIAGSFQRPSYVGEWAVTATFLDANAGTGGGFTAPDFLVGLRTRSSSSAEQIDRSIAQLAAEFAGVDIQSRAAFGAQRQGQIDQVLRVITAMLTLSLLVATIGIGVSMALSVIERRRELGLVRMIGMERRQLRRMIRWEAAIVSLFGALLGVGLGLPLAVTLVNVQQSSFVGQLVVPYGWLATLISLALAAGLLAAMIPAANASRLNPVEAVRSA
jgi:putative ABC transport system permease protein